MKLTALKISLVSLLIITSLTTYAQVNTASTINNSRNQGNKYDSDLKAQVQQWLKKQSVQFLENKGQMTDMDGKPTPFVLFKAEASGIDMYITEKGITYNFIQSEEQEEKNGSNREENTILKWARVDMELKGANIRRENIIKEKESVEHFNFFYSHCSDGIYDVKQYQKITIREVYQGIDWVLYNTNDKGFKYDFIVHPGADYKVIELLYRTEQPIELSDKGSLKIKTKHGNLCENSPISFYRERTINTQFLKTQPKLINSNKKHGYETSVTFSFPDSDFSSITSDLIIDPQLVWATLVGGSNQDMEEDIATDASGNIFVTGTTSSNGFPLLTAGTYYQSTRLSWNTTFIMKFNNLLQLVWSTYYSGTIDATNGGSSYDEHMNIAIDPISNDVYVSGATTAINLPCFTSGGQYYKNIINGSQDIFILKFSNTGVRLWATYYGGDAEENSYSIDVGTNGNVVVTATTASSNWLVNPWSSAYFDNTIGGNSDHAIIMFDSFCNLLWSTYIGGSANEPGFCPIAKFDQVGNLYVMGSTNSTDFPVLLTAGGYFNNTMAGFSEWYILKFNPIGVLTWGTLYGGSNTEYAGMALNIDVNGNLFITASTASTDVPLINPLGGSYFDPTNTGASIIAKFDSGTNIIWATYYDGMKGENIGVDSCGLVYIVGSSYTGGVNTKTSNCGYFDGTYAAGFGDLVILKFTNAGILLWATYYGNAGNEGNSHLAIDVNNNLFITGNTGFLSAIIPPLLNPGPPAYFDGTYGGGSSRDYFILKFIPDIPTTISSQINSTTCSPCNGSATVSVDCGNPDYSYVWNNGSVTSNTLSATNTITNLCPSSYTVTVTSKCSQSKTEIFVITGVTCNNITANVNSATTCSGAIPCSIITATGVGGVAPYTYLWNTGQTSQNINPCPLTTTNYTVTIKDNTGATASSTGIIAVNPAVTASSISGIINCSGGKSSVTATGTSGTSPYTYNWSTGVTTTGASSTIPNLSANTYSVTVTDSKGCTTTTSVLLTDPPPLLGQFTKGTSACSNCGCKEWLMVNATGGTPPYSYQWPDGYDKRYKNKVCSGNYMISIKDKNNCSVDVNVTTP